MPNTVDVPNGAKAEAAGAEGARKTPPWIYDNYDGSDFRRRGRSLESLQVLTAIDGPSTSARVARIYEDNVGTLGVSQVRKLLNDASRLQDPKMELIMTDLVSRPPWEGGSYYATATVRSIGWASANDTQREAYKAYLAEKEQAQLKADREALRQIAKRNPSLVADSTK
jgi:hypothetical protein